MDLKKYVTSKKMMLSELAAIAGIQQSYVSLIKNGHRVPSPKVALRIEKATGGEVTRMELLYPKKKKQ